MMIGRRDFALGAAATLAGVRAAAATEDERAAMARDAAAFLESHSVPGLSVAIAKGGEIVYRAAFGLASKSRDERATPDHRFRIASVSKPVTAVAVFRLFEAGLLLPGDRVFGPGGALGPLGAGLDRDSPLHGVTVDHLLTHTAGAWPNDATDPMFANGDMDHARLIESTLANVRSFARPGETYKYSNFGYCLLGRIVERATGRAYADFARETVLAPVGAGGMAIAGNSRDERAPNEVEYHGIGTENPYGPNVRRMDSHGGWIATASEVALFVAGAAGRIVPPLLSEASMAKMSEGTAANPKYARGWNVNAAGNWWHTGSLPGTQTIAVRTRSGFSWAAFVNMRNRGTSLAGDLDKLIWKMARRVPAWRV
ncbi:MAG: beta-lactamase family protein [Rhodospirillales bacterium]|nr:beta-lactamase family protein [Rhodospirillales bacterium]